AACGLIDAGAVRHQWFHRELRGGRPLHRRLPGGRGFAAPARYCPEFSPGHLHSRPSEGPLCDAVTGRDDGKATLEALERANLFVVPLDDRRRWYRYHHLFADVLRARLLDEQPEQVPELHRRASAWYERNGEMPEAIRHTLAAGDFSKAADLIELSAPALRRSRQEAALPGWLAALPDELLRGRPVLSNVFAGELLAGGKLEDADA